MGRSKDYSIGNPSAHCRAIVTRDNFQPLRQVVCWQPWATDFLPCVAAEGCRSAVFLPASGNRNGTTVNNAGQNGNYWSSTQNDANNAYNLNFNSNNLNPQNNNNRNNGFSVRLARVVEQ